MPTPILAEFTNEADGVTALVARSEKGGFAVALRDDDSGEFVGYVRTYPTYDHACQVAKMTADGEPACPLCAGRGFLYHPEPLPCRNCRGSGHSRKKIAIGA